MYCLACGGRYRKDVGPEAAYVHERCGGTFHRDCVVMSVSFERGCPNCHGSVEMGFSGPNPILRGLLSTPHYRGLPMLQWANREKLPPDPWKPTLVYANLGVLQGYRVPHAAVPGVLDHHRPKDASESFSLTMVVLDEIKINDFKYRRVSPCFFCHQIINRETLLSLNRFLNRHFAPPPAPSTAGRRVKKKPRRRFCLGA